MTLELLIVRHAIAVDREAGWEDADRPLTLKGVARLEKAVAGLTRHGVALDRVQVILGHRDIAMTRRYAETRPEALREAIAATFN